MAKAQKESMTLVSSAGTGYFYINRKNKKKSKGEGKLKLKKYDPRTRKHVLFEEKKLSKLKAKFKAGDEPKDQKPAKEKPAQEAA
jgi:large subunit ribosomal protein L33